MMKRYSLPQNANGLARALRRNATAAEQTLWRALREHLPTHKFRRQVPMGCYIADFACHASRLIVELDGGQHAVQTEQDRQRTDFLNGEGYLVLRFWNNQVVENLEGVLASIHAALTPHPNPLPQGERAFAMTTRADAAPLFEAGA